MKGTTDTFIAALLERDEAFFEKLKATRAGEHRLSSSLLVRRAGDEWSIEDNGQSIMLRTDDVERLYDVGYETRRMQRMMSFPLGATLCDGNFEIVSEIRGTPDRGMYEGREVGSGQPLLITLGGPHTRELAEVRENIALRVDGIAPLRYVGPLDGRAEYVGLVEDRPPGEPMSRVSLPLDPDDAAALILQVADVLSDAPPVIGLRPELMFRQNDVVGLAPRAEPFLMTVRPSSQGTPACFENFYLAPELLAAPLDAHDQKADVFSLAAILGHWVIGHPLFEGEGPSQGISIATNKRRPAILPHRFAAVIEAGLMSDPNARPDLDEWAAALRRVSDGEA